MKFLPSLLLAVSFIAAHATHERFRGRVSCSTPTSYKVTFVNRWTRIRHPPSFPSSDAHWSGPVYAAHNSRYVMWNAQMKASPGVKEVAETGGQQPLTDELEASRDVLDFMTSGPMFGDRHEIGILNVDRDHSLISGITMIAPSPDWFAGIHDVNVCGRDGFWLDFVAIDGFPYDGGTDDGINYRSPDSPNIPVNMFRLTPRTVSPFTNVLVSRDFFGQKRVLPVALTILERVTSSNNSEDDCAPDENFRYKQEGNRDCAWVSRVRRRNPGRWLTICERVQRVGFTEKKVKNFCPRECNSCSA